MSAARDIVKYANAEDRMGLFNASLDAIIEEGRLLQERQSQEDWWQQLDQDEQQSRD